MASHVLVTGGTGFIGSHTVVSLIEAGYTPVIVDNLSFSDPSILDGVERITGVCPALHVVDIRDSVGLRKVFEAYQFTAVIHFAGLKIVGESTVAPLRFHDNNIIGSIRLFELMEEFGVRNILFSSSASVYAHGTPMPLREDSRTAHNHPYGMTKIVVEELLHDLAACRKWHAINLRYFNPVGGHPSGHIGENIHVGGDGGSLFSRVMRVATG